MRIHFSLMLTLSVALLLVALPVLAQPPLDAASLTVRALAADGTPLTDNFSVSLRAANSAPLAYQGQPIIYPGSVTYVGLTAGDLQIQMYMAKYQWRETRVVTLVPGENVVEWRRPTPSSLVVKVTTAVGKTMTTPYTVLLFGLGDTNFAPVTQRSGDAGQEAVTLTDLIPGRYLAKVDGETDFAYDIREVEVQQGSNTLDWKLPPLASLNVVPHFQGTLPEPYALTFILTRTAVWGKTSQTLASPDDTVTFNGISAGEYTLSVGNGNGELNRQQVTLVPGENTVNWTLPALTTLTIIACDSDGTPLPANKDLMWQVSLLRDGKRLVDNTLTAGDSMAFRDLLGITYTLRFDTISGYVWDLRTVDMSAGDITLKWTPALLATVTLHVTNADGSPLEKQQLTVILTNLKDGVDRPRYGGRNTPGTVNCVGMPAGDYRIALQIPGMDVVPERTLTFAPGVQTIEWRLPPYFAVSGALTVDGKLVTPTRGTAVLTLDQTVNDGTTPITFANGRYTVKDVLPTEDRLILLTDAGWADVPVKPTFTGSAVDIPVTLQPGGALEAHNIPPNTDVNGHKQSPGRIYLTHTNGADADLRLVFRADWGCQVRLPSLPPGHWRWQMEPAGPDGILRGEMDIVAGQTQTIWGAQNPPPAGGL